MISAHIIIQETLADNICRNKRDYDREYYRPL